MIQRSSPGPRKGGVIGASMLLFAVVCYGKQIVESPHLRSSVIGGAYDSDKQTFIGSQCVAGNVEPVGGSESTLALDQSMSEAQASTSLGFGTGARARYGAVKASAAASFLSRASSSEYSASSIYSASYVFRKNKLSVPELSPIGKSVENNHERWRQTCGDSYVTEIQTGARFFFSVKIEFASKEEAKNFSANFKIGGAAGSVSQSIKQASRRFSKSSKITVAVYQSGGDVEKLSGIFGGSADGSKSYLQCTLGDFEACATVLANAIRYATDTNSGFPSQLVDASKRVTLAYDVTEYAAAGLYRGPAPFVDQYIELKRRDLANYFERQYNLRKRIDALLAIGPAYIDTADLTASSGGVNKNLESIVEASVVCYEQPTKCGEAVDSLQLSELSDRLFEIPRLYEMCARAYTRRDEETKRTIWALLIDSGADGESLVKSVDLPPQCGGKSQQNRSADGQWEVLTAVTSSLGTAVDISRSGLAKRHRHPIEVSTIVPLATGAKELKVIDISGQRVSDISTLALIPQMEKLRASGNRITELNALSFAQELTELDVTDNRVGDLAPLAGLQNLRSVSADGNVLSSLEGVAGLPRLSLLRLSRNQLTNLDPLSALPNLEEVHAQRNVIRSLKGFQPVRLRRLEIEENPLPQSEIEEFCGRSPGTRIAYTGADGLPKFGVCRRPPP